ncbi:MAG: TetR/AcrR family transcriptional regulator [Desulfobacterales bacterium]|nr:TetR/AcrR family transcriptional regulator [Desulfobacterales bacterium]MBS3755141.1 TetR/AcrR family transcriptional regulator [Desulfobacterales bacterium]
MKLEKTARQVPPGQVKIENALRLLLEHKDFNSITTAEIARTSGVNEALIYRYFKDKRGLLHQVLANDLKALVLQIKKDVEDIRGALDKLHGLIRGHIHYYAENRIIAKILLLEVRNYPAYFESESYRIVQDYGKMILELIEEGVRTGEIRDDIAPHQIRQAILGGIEHLCLPGVIFGGEIPADRCADDLCEIISHGISNQTSRET